MVATVVTLPSFPAATADDVYSKLAPIYDLIYGYGLEPGRRVAFQRLALRGSERVLEVGVGTALSTLHYPRGCRVVGIDLSAPMLARARARLRTAGHHHVTLCRMDGLRLAFADDVFDAVYAPYFVNTVPDPIAVAREMVRVCRPGGRIVFLGHFRDHSPTWMQRAIGELATRISDVDWDLDLGGFLDGAKLQARSNEPVNLFGVSSVVLCVK